MSMDDVKSEARMKGLMALGSTVGAGVFWAVWWPLGLLGTIGASFFIYQWFTFRAKWGMKF